MSYEWEESFSQIERRDQKKKKKLSQSRDRSQFKKTDVDQKKKNQIDLKHQNEPLFKGRVLSILLEGIEVNYENQLYLCTLKGGLKQKNTQTKNLVAVGDFVLFKPLEKNTGIIVQICERFSIFSRADNLLRRKEQLIAVNIDQVLITCSVIQPQLKPALIDRYIIATQKGGMKPVILINKIDLLYHLKSDATEGEKRVLDDEMAVYQFFLETYPNIGVEVLSLSTKTGEGFERLKEVMKERASVFSGASGVGKTSIINRLFETNLPIGFIAKHRSKGVHTTSTTKLIPMESGGFCIDTPGIRSFGLWNIKKEDIGEYFQEIFDFGKNCRYQNCYHLEEPGCAVLKAVEEKKISHLRFTSYCTLIADASKEHRHR